MICGACGTENRSDRRFCLRCGTSLPAACPTCGASNEAEAAFCGACGTRLGAQLTVPGTARPAPEPGGRPPEPAAHGAPAAERRLVSVLFADLVGFTAVAEGLDPEDARGLLDRYFAAAREIVDRYGGIVEKFIGDAVMAVWGTPTAHEDDAERAVRAALDLIAAIPRLDGTGLEGRAAVLTGEAAVALNATGQGMVAGDLVNTASRLQSVADPGTVLVGEATMRAASGAVSFEPVGERTLKGKTAPLPAWRAISVVAKVRGAGRRDRVEPPFVGRDAEFALLKERLHATTRDRRARLVSITGVAGIGKSRLAWELEKYLDGVVETVYWHQGRSLAYGDGVAFWALGEMVRRRAGIAERDDPATTEEKLAATAADYVSDDEERRWVLPRLRVLLGLVESPADTRDELFAAWRRFFERIAERATVVLVFEDLQWADEGQVDFIRSLMDWSRQYPILIVTIARPELFERHPTWGAGQRDFTSLHLDPLPTEAMEALVAGVAPGLPPSTARTIVQRAEGIPLYAVELFRMLVDRGRIRRSEGAYDIVDDGELEVPETLQSLIAARLDALAPQERRLVQDAAVLGQSFAVDSLAALTGDSVQAIEPVLRALVRRELLSIDADPRSPERGQYGFVGALVREVAYGTLARRDRRVRHLAAARYFEALGDDELAGVLASHYLAAHASSTPGPEADAVGAQARIALRGAAERALGLASPEQAVTYLRQALEVTPEPVEAARLHEEIARAAVKGGLWAIADAEARAAYAAYEALGDPRDLALASSILGNLEFHEGRIDVAATRLEAALRALQGSDPLLELEMYRQLGRAEMFRSRPERAMEWVESGLAAAARLDDLDSIADLLITRGWAAAGLGRVREGIAETRGAMEFARRHGLAAAEGRAINNLGTFLLDEDPAEAIALVGRGVELGERLGDRDWLQKLAFIALGKAEAGDWNGAQELVERWLHEDAPNLDYLPLAAARATMLAWRDQSSDVADQLRRIRERVQSSEGTQDRFGLTLAELNVSLASGDHVAARAAATQLEAVDIAVGGTGWDGIAHRGLMDARARDREGLLDAIRRLGAARPRFGPTIAMRRALEACLLALEGRPRESALAAREALDQLRRLGLLMHALLVDLALVAALPADDPLAAEAVAEVRGFASRTGAVNLERRIDDALGSARRRGPGSVEGQAAGAAPENARTTS